MIDTSKLISILLMTSGVTAVSCTLYVIQRNYNLLINKIFFILGCCLLLWSSGLAMRTVSANEAVAAIGSCIAPIGYGAMFSFLLHYILLLTGRNELLKKRWIYLLMYLPGLVTVFGLVVLPVLGKYRYDLALTSLGWVNNTVNIWVWFYYFYYVVFWIAGTLFLRKWSLESGSKTIRRQAGMLIKSILAMGVLATLTDVLTVFLGIQLPGVAVIFALLPVFSICYSVNRLGFMQSAALDINAMILDKPTRVRIYQILGLCFIAGGFLNLLSQHLLSQEIVLQSVFLFSGILLLIGLSILILSRIGMDEDFKELLVAFMMSFFIPFIILRFSIYGSITIWAFFFLMIAVSMLFNKLVLLVSVLLSSILSQLLVWCITPHVYVKIDAADYIVRLGLIVLAAVLCLFVNKIYRNRLRDNANHWAKQALISEISHSMISVNTENFGDIIMQTLKKCSLFIRCAYAFFALFGEQPEQTRVYCQWLTEGTMPDGNGLKRVLSAIYPEVHVQFEKNKIFQLSDVEELPQEYADIKAEMLHMNIGGLIVLPVLQGQKEIGFIGFVDPRPVYEWNLDSTVFLSIIANTVSEAVAKIEDMNRIHHIAYHDQLTALPNRILFKDRLNQAIRLASHTSKILGVVFLDLDGFKSINDTMGHDLGDRLLVEMGRTISENIRDYDTVSRFGGDEFVLLLNQFSDVGDLLRVMDKLMEMTQKVRLLDGQEFFTTVSAGVALYPQDGTDAETLIKNADIAMYHAKNLGKNRYVLCSQNMKDQVMDQMKLTNLLYRAQEKEQLMLYYQPQIDLATRTVVGLEALIRWNLPGMGFVSPATFIPLAEQNGLIQSIGAWVLETACRQTRCWQNMGLPDIRVAVNISLYQLKNKNFVLQVNDILEKTGLAPEYLELEITESVANSGSNDIVEILSQLKELGISLSIDDFGTEYSSLSRLKLLPADRLKLDMQFVRGIETNEKDQALTIAIISLAKSLQMKIIAEGVETALQLDFLSQKLCDEVQGFYYYKPMPAEEVEKILRNVISEDIHKSKETDGGGLL